MEGGIRQPKSFSRHFAVNGTIILAFERGDDIQAVIGVSHVVFVLVIICICHIFFLPESVSLAKLDLVSLFKTEQLHPQIQKDAALAF